VHHSAILAEVPVMGEQMLNGAAFIIFITALDSTVPLALIDLR
jgi:hypothetical protein